VSGRARSTSKPIGTSHSKVAGGMLLQAPENPMVTVAAKP